MTLISYFLRPSELYVRSNNARFLHISCVHFITMTEPSTAQTSATIPRIVAGPVRRSRLPLLAGAVACIAVLAGLLLTPDSGASCPYLPAAGPAGRLVAVLASAQLASITVGRLLAAPMRAAGILPPASDGAYDADGMRLFSLEELRQHDGSDPARPLHLAIGGDVFDVSVKGAQFYGPGMGYSLFAGRDATRSLALGSLDHVDLERGDDIADFTPQQLEALREQHAFYKGKYPRVGRLRVEERRSVPAPSAPSPSEAAVLVPEANEAVAV